MSEINPQFAQEINQYWSTMLNNFIKIANWLTKGETQDSPFPPVVKGMVDGAAQAHAQHRQNYESVVQQLQGIAQVGQLVETLRAENQELSKRLDEMTENYNALVKTVDGLVAPKKSTAKKEKAAPTPAPEQAPAPAPQPVVQQPQPQPAAAQPQQTEIAVSAAAIGAGELSGDALNQLDSLLTAL